MTPFDGMTVGLALGAGVLLLFVAARRAVTGRWS